MNKITLELNPTETQFIIDLLNLHAEGLSQWWNEEKGWANVETAVEYSDTKALRRAIDRAVEKRC